MSGLVVALALLPAVFAIPFPPAEQGTRNAHVVLQVNKVTAEAAVEVWNLNKSEVFAQSCSRLLISEPFKSTPVAFSVNDYGAGNLTIGQQTYMIHEKPEISGGIVCGRIVSPDEIIVSCEVAISQSLHRRLQDLKTRDLRNCFPHGPVELTDVMRGLEDAPTERAIPSPQTASSNNTTGLGLTALGKRQGACGVWSQTTFNVGDGNPHQNPLNIQISVSLFFSSSRTLIYYLS